MTSAADQPQEFHDESGRLLYSIDPHGVVTMYEKDALDNTISTTRGPRDAMKPLIMEVSPPAIEPGKMTVVIFKGVNLVGAKFKTRSQGLKFGRSVPRASTAGVPVEVDPSVKPGVVTIDVSTPLGATSTSLTILEPRADSGTQARRQAPEKAPRPGKPESCPESMIAIPSSTGGFCIDIHQTQEGDWFFVEKACSYHFKRLCWSEEWEQACKQQEKGGISLQSLLGQWEWTRTSEYAVTEDPATGRVPTENGDWLAVIRDKENCISKDKKDPWLGGSLPGRCCK